MEIALTIINGIISLVCGVSAVIFFFIGIQYCKSKEIEDLKEVRQAFIVLIICIPLFILGVYNTYCISNLRLENKELKTNIKNINKNEKQSNRNLR